MKRATRLLLIIQLLRDRPYTCEEIAERCGVSERTIRRDLLDLQSDLNVPIVARRIWEIVQNWSGIVRC